MTELEIAVNQRVGEWEVIQESGTSLQPLFGPGLTGMKNLGNSCYLNSVMQVLFTVPDFEIKSVPAVALQIHCLPCVAHEQPKFFRFLLVLLDSRTLGPPLTPIQ